MNPSHEFPERSSPPRRHVPTPSRRVISPPRAGLFRGHPGDRRAGCAQYAPGSSASGQTPAYSSLWQSGNQGDWAESQVLAAIGTDPTQWIARRRWSGSRAGALAVYLPRTAAPGYSRSQSAFPGPLSRPASAANGQQPQAQRPTREALARCAIRTLLQNTEVVRILAGVTAASSGQTIYDAAILEHPDRQRAGSV